MFVAETKDHLGFGTHDRRCWSCAAWVQPDNWPSMAQPMGDCTAVRWLWKMPVTSVARARRIGEPEPEQEFKMVQQMTHADDVCAKYEEAYRSIDAREERALRAGLG